MFATRWVTLFIVLFACGLATAQDMTFDLLRDGLKDPARWLTYSGDYRGTRHSPLTQITPANVAEIAPQWTFQTGAPGKLEPSPSTSTASSFSIEPITTPGPSTPGKAARSGDTNRGTLPASLAWV